MRALAPFLAFAPALRQAGLPAAPEQVQSFLAAVGLLGPDTIRDIRRAAHAVFGPGPERREAFDEVFDAVFLGRIFVAPGEGRPEELPESFAAGDFDLLPNPDDETPSGAEATQAERLFARALQAQDETHMLPAALPRRRSRRMIGGGHRPDPRATFRQMPRRDGEIASLPRRKRRPRQRRVLMLIDVSGSMKAGTDGALRLAHALVQAGSGSRSSPLARG